MYVIPYNSILEQNSNLVPKFHNEDVSIPVVGSSEGHETSLQRALTTFLDKIHYSFTSYPEFKELELAVRNEILSFGIDLRPGWEKILHTACTLVGMEYFKHPIEMQFSIAVRSQFSFFLCGTLDS